MFLNSNILFENVFSCKTEVSSSKFCIISQVAPVVDVDDKRLTLLNSRPFGKGSSLYVGEGVGASIAL